VEFGGCFVARRIPLTFVKRPHISPTQRRHVSASSSAATSSDCDNPLIVGVCGNCHKVHCGWTFVCNACGSLLEVQRPASGWNYFEVFGQKPRFELSDTQLEKTYKSMQMLLHPDRFCNANDEQKKLADQHSAFIAEAYRVLRSKLPRAKHLIKHVYKQPLFQSATLSVDDSSEANANVVDQELLMEILEINDEIDEARDLAEIQVLQKRCFRIMEDSYQKLGDALSREDWSAAKNQIQALNMYSRVDNRLKYWEFGDAHKELIGQM